MAGETIGFKGSFTSIVSAAAIADGAFSSESTAISSALTTGDESDYVLLDFQLIHSSGTATTGDVFNLYQRSTDGTNKAPAPVSDFKQKYMGTFTLDNAAATSYYYLLGIPNNCPEATYYIEADTTNSLTVALSVRGRTYKAAA